MRLILAGMWLAIMPVGAAAPARAEGVGPSASPSGGGMAGWRIGSYLLLPFGVRVILATILGARAVRRANPWPHWTGLTLGLGGAAFLPGIAVALHGLWMSFREIVRLGAAVASTDVAAGLQSPCASLLAATLVALLSLAGAGVIHLSEKRAPQEADGGRAGRRRNPARSG